MSTVWLCGAGMLGSWWLRFHAQRAFALGLDHPLIVIDNDVIEGRNLPSQNFTERNVGARKADVLVGTLSDYHLRGLSIAQRLDLANGKELLEENPPSLIVDAFDNHTSRVVAMLLAKRAGCECLHISVSPQRFGRVEWSNKWHLDPTRLLEPVSEEETELPPCELVAFQNLGVLIGIKAAIETSQLLVGNQAQSWMITDHQTVTL